MPGTTANLSRSAQSGAVERKAPQRFPIANARKLPEPRPKRKTATLVEPPFVLSDCRN